MSSLFLLAEPGQSTYFRCTDNTLVSDTDVHFMTTCNGDGTYAIPAACRTPATCSATLGVPTTNLLPSTTNAASLAEFGVAVYECPAGMTLNPADPGVTFDGKLEVRCLGATFDDPAVWPTC